MIRGKVAILIAVVGLAAGMHLGPAAAAPTAPGDPVPTAAHPYQGMRRLTVATVPAVPGMQFAVDGTVFTTNAQGVATILVTKAQRAAVRADRDHHLAVVTPVLAVSAGVRARFTGWSGPGVYRSGTPAEEYQTATFAMEYLTNFTFATRAGHSVDSKSLVSMRLESSLGRRITLKPPHPVWLQGSRTTSGPLGLQSRAVSYRIDSVTTSGANVVHEGQQQFFPSRRQQVDVALLLFDVRFSARDALLGSGTGSGVALEYPDGHVDHLGFGPGGAVTVRQMPHGTYHVTVEGSGPELPQKLTVSQNQAADVDAVTWIDLAIGIMFLLSIVVGLFVIRWALRRRGGADADADRAGEQLDEEPDLVRTR